MRLDRSGGAVGDKFADSGTTAGSGAESIWLLTDIEIMRDHIT